MRSLALSYITIYKDALATEDSTRVGVTQWKGMLFNVGASFHDISTIQLTYLPAGCLVIVGIRTLNLSSTSERRVIYGVSS